MIADATEGLADTPAGRVVINSEPLFAAKVVAPFLAEMQRDLPEIDLRLIGSTDIADTAINHGLRLSHLLAANTYRAMG